MLVTGDFNAEPGSAVHTGHRIDWIIGTAAFDFRQAGVNHWYPHDHLHVASDHWAYQAKLRLT